MIRRQLVRSGLLALVAAAVALPAGAQSVLARRGLGYPIEPLDARSRGMGGVSLAPGVVFSLINPTASAGVPAPAASATLQSDWFDAAGEGVEVDGGTARFPQIAMAFPLSSRWSASLGYGAFLDQNWGAVATDSMDLVTGRVAVVDRFLSVGGIARLRAGTAYRVLPRLVLGVAGEVYTGVVRDTLVRNVGNLTPVFFHSSYRYSGTTGSVGVRWTPLDALSLNGAATMGGTLKGTAEDSAGISREYSLPLTLDGGAAARITRLAQVAASVHWAGWSDASDALAARGGARDALTVAAGLEYEGVSLLNTGLPLRVGARLNQLPFRWDNGEFIDERALTAGLGMRMARGTAQLDFAAERGWRGGADAGIEEPYWRASATVSILGR